MLTNVSYIHIDVGENKTEKENKNIGHELALASSRSQSSQVDLEQVEGRWKWPAVGEEKNKEKCDQSAKGIDACLA